jgi:hypothetical protein
MVPTTTTKIKNKSGNNSSAPVVAATKQLHSEMEILS